MTGAKSLCFNVQIENQTGTILGNLEIHPISCNAKIGFINAGEKRCDGRQRPFNRWHSIHRPLHGQCAGVSAAMTYCVGVMLESGMIFASDSRTHAGVDNFASFCKLSLFERKGDRVIVLLSSGNLGGTQAVISILRQNGERAGCPSLWSAESMFDVALLVSDAMRTVDQRDGQHVVKETAGFYASFILGGQIRGEAPRLFRLYAEGNFIEAGDQTPYFQTGETKYGKPIIDWAITRSTSLNDAAKCVLVSFESTMRSNLSVGMPIDLISYEIDSLEVTNQRRFEPGDTYFTTLGTEWSAGTREVFSRLDDLEW